MISHIMVTYIRKNCNFRFTDCNDNPGNWSNILFILLKSEYFHMRSAYFHMIVIMALQITNTVQILIISSSIADIIYSLISHMHISGTYKIVRQSKMRRNVNLRIRIVPPYPPIIACVLSNISSNFFLASS